MPRRQRNLGAQAQAHYGILRGKSPWPTTFGALVLEFIDANSAAPAKPSKAALLSSAMSGDLPFACHLRGTVTGPLKAKAISFAETRA